MPFLLLLSNYHYILQFQLALSTCNCQINQNRPTVKWSEITAEYAGLFFRAEGGDSEQFGDIQAGSSPRLTSVRGRLVLSTAVAAITLNANGLASPTLSAGATGAANHWGLSFTVSSDEVRPRNTAMRIWKRD